MAYYPVDSELSIPVEATDRYERLSLRELDQGGRVIGGDRGDLWFEGYYVESGRTVLNSPVLMSHIDLTPDEVTEIAEEVLLTAYESLGEEAVW